MISLVINCDTRQGIEQDQSIEGLMMSGTRSYDFLYEGVLNKINFFRGYPVEVILFIDRHQDIPFELFEKWKEIPNLTFCISQHREYFGDQLHSKWNDHNYLQALYLARGSHIVHFDGDTNAFRSDDCKIINAMINMVDTNQYTYVSYPSHWSPYPVCNINEWEYWWASTRFFFCKRSALDFTEIEKCLSDSGYLYHKYGDKKHRCPWTEHILSIIAGPGKVYYPPVTLSEYAIFSWAKYQKGTLKVLNDMSYNDVRSFVQSKGGISYPCNVTC